MKRSLTALATLLLLGACTAAPFRGDAHSVKAYLTKTVPVGSSQARLIQEAQQRGWRVDSRNAQVVEDGGLTYMNATRRHCRGKGGFAVPVLVAEYGVPFTTSVESLWLFDAGDRLVDICVRKTVDAL